MRGTRPSPRPPLPLGPQLQGGRDSDSWSHGQQGPGSRGTRRELLILHGLEEVGHGSSPFKLGTAAAREPTGTRGHSWRRLRAWGSGKSVPLEMQSFGPVGLWVLPQPLSGGLMGPTPPASPRRVGWWRAPLRQVLNLILPFCPPRPREEEALGTGGPSTCHEGSSRSASVGLQLE